MQYQRLLLSLLIPLAGMATSIVRLSLEDTVAQAQWIVEADVVRNWCSWDSGHRFIWTHTELAIRDHWKGAVGSTITVSEPGGAVDGLTMNVVGMVRYNPGERVVAFLYRTPIGLIRTVGLAQGKLRVDARGLVHPESAAAALVSPIGRGSAGTSVGELEGNTTAAVHNRIAHLSAIPQGARK
ncbi:MAG TPA: hypothetical protein VGL72_22880 [Bryobacteraceae bacterium]|jgi:hypothetical protein